jgi:RNA polymerase sigma factor (sigma-70 family)
MSSGQENYADVALPSPAQGDEEVHPGGFEGFLSDNYLALVRYLRGRTTSPQDAEDVAQESLTRLLRYRESKPPSAWKPLLFRIATNILHDYSRQGHTGPCWHQVPLEDVALRIADAQAGPERVLDDRLQLDQILAAIENLPGKCRQVFLLSRFHGMNNQAIAEYCGISVRMVEKQISKALAICRSRLEG